MALRPNVWALARRAPPAAGNGTSSLVAPASTKLRLWRSVLGAARAPQTSVSPHLKRIMPGPEASGRGPPRRRHPGVAGARTRRPQEPHAGTETTPGPPGCGSCPGSTRRRTDTGCTAPDYPVDQGFVAVVCRSNHRNKSLINEEGAPGDACRRGGAGGSGARTVRLRERRSGPRRTSRQPTHTAGEPQCRELITKPRQ